MFVNLQRYGIKRIINANNISFEIISDTEIGIITLEGNDCTIKFKDKREADEFLSIFTGGFNNI